MATPKKTSKRRRIAGAAVRILAGAGAYHGARRAARTRTARRAGAFVGVTALGLARKGTYAYMRHSGRKRIKRRKMTELKNRYYRTKYTRP